MWRKTQITDDAGNLIFYSAFIDGKLEAPRTLLPEVHRPVLRTVVPGIRSQYYVEPLERIYQRV